MDKRGDLTIRYIILIALGIIVLIVVALIFSKGMSEFSAQLKDIMKQIVGLKSGI